MDEPDYIIDTDDYTKGKPEKNTDSEFLIALAKSYKISKDKIKIERDGNKTLYKIGIRVIYTQYD